MSRVFSLVVLPGSAECIPGQIVDVDNPPPGSAWQGRSIRLVHEQRQEQGARWFIYGDASLSKPETLARARQWLDSSRHPYRPDLRA